MTKNNILNELIVTDRDILKSYIYGGMDVCIYLSIYHRQVRLQLTLLFLSSCFFFLAQGRINLMNSTSQFSHPH